MVMPLGPGKFYGRSLPRPRVYDDVKFNDVRLNPPVPVMDPFLSWADEAHWSMGGLSFKRLRLQGRIEGNISKLRVQQEKLSKKKQMISILPKANGIHSDPSGFEYKISSGSKRAAPDSPPPAPIATKMMRYLAVREESDDDKDSADEETSDEAGKQSVRRRLVKKLEDEFDTVASENDQVAGSIEGGPFQKGFASIASRIRSRSLSRNKNRMKM